MSRTRRIVVGTAAAAAVVLAVCVGVVVSGRNSTSAVVPPPVLAGESACGLPGTPGDSADGATAVTWTSVAGWPLPTSKTDGPGVRDPHGSWSCYARTRSGAVLAGYVIPMLVGGLADDRAAVIRQQTIPGPGQEVLLGTVPNSQQVITPRGFYVAAYSDDVATIRYRLTTATGDFACTTDVRWTDGDWRLVLGDDGSTSSGCANGTPDQFTPWGP